MNIARVLVIVAALLCLTSESRAFSADWPMWRHGLERNGVSSEPLPETLNLHWSRQLLKPKPAWPNEPRLHFDASYEPVAAGKQLFVGSMVDGSLAAFDIETGSLNWRFYSDGPVRLAPAVADGRVYFGSDDGLLYCLDAESGKLLWKLSGAPAERGQRRHLGNGRLISFWPVRGGPVVDDGVVYFGAGIWPTMGVFVRAADATTGKLLWTNGDSNAIKNLRIDHNYSHEGGISPQGHLLITGDTVVVPNGRSMPARLDRKTGELKYFVQGYRNGDSRVSISGDIALVGATGVVNLNDGREIASLWAKAGDKAPKSWSGDWDLFEAPLLPYKFSPAIDYRSAVIDGIAYGVENGTIYAYDLQNSKLTRYEKEQYGKQLKPARWDAPLRWKLDTPFAGKKQTTRSVIVAGDRLYSHSGRTLFAVDLPKADNKEATVAWTHELPAEPGSLIAANGRLIVATLDGTIHCFGEGTLKSKTHSRVSESVAAVEPAAAQLAASILKESAVTDGYAVVLGFSNQQLVDELLRSSELRIIAVDSSSARINELRQRLMTNGDYSDRLQLIEGNPDTADIPPYIANLLIVSDEAEAPMDSDERVKRMFEMLRPYGGKACVVTPDGENAKILSHVSPGTLPGVKTRSTEDMVVVTREGPLRGSAVWSHETGDASRSFFSRDELVKAPLGVLWYGDGPDHGFYKRKDYGHGVKPQVAGGRMFALQIASNTLHAVDAYTGRLLWTRKVGGSARYVSMPEAVYVGDERECLVLDAGSGETLHTFPLDVSKPDEIAVSVTDIRVDGEVIVIAVRFNKENSIPKGRWNSELIVCLDRSTGKQLWSRQAEHRYNTAAIAVAGGRVFCIDSHSPEDIGAMKRRGIETAGLASTLLAINDRTGAEVWKKVVNDPPAVMDSLHFMSLRTRDDWLEYSVDHDLIIAGKDARTFAVNATTGDEVWKAPMRGNQPLILGPETFINQAGHTYDVKTGKLISGAALFRRGGCNYAVGNVNLLFLRSNCAAYVDVKTGKQFNIRSLRSGCSNSLVAADGLLNVPCFSMGCVCNYPIQTSFAMRHMPETEAWLGSNPIKFERPVSTPDE
ncbi:MAG: outer membrane protein assembly factor BamB [Planctomycetaceae bacterium]|jgi:outer membrane protein assembly factor BamB